MPTYPTKIYIVSKQDRDEASRKGKSTRDIIREREQAYRQSQTKTKAKAEGGKVQATTRAGEILTALYGVNSKQVQELAAERTLVVGETRATGLGTSLSEAEKEHAAQQLIKGGYSSEVNPQTVVDIQTGGLKTYRTTASGERIETTQNLREAGGSVLTPGAARVFEEIQRQEEDKYLRETGMNRGTFEDIKAGRLKIYKRQSSGKLIETTKDLGAGRSSSPISVLLPGTVKEAITDNPEIYNKLSKREKELLLGSPNIVSSQVKKFFESQKIEQTKVKEEPIIKSIVIGKREAVADIPGYSSLVKKSEVQRLYDLKKEFESPPIKENYPRQLIRKYIHGDGIPPLERGMRAYYSLGQEMEKGAGIAFRKIESGLMTSLERVVPKSEAELTGTSGLLQYKGRSPTTFKELEEVAVGAGRTEKGQIPASRVFVQDFSRAFLEFPKAATVAVKKQADIAVLGTLGLVAGPESARAVGSEAATALIGIPKAIKENYNPLTGRGAFALAVTTVFGYKLAQKTNPFINTRPLTIPRGKEAKLTSMTRQQYREFVRKTPLTKAGKRGIDISQESITSRQLLYRQQKIINLELAGRGQIIQLGQAGKISITRILDPTTGKFTQILSKPQTLTPAKLTVFQGKITQQFTVGAYKTTTFRHGIDLSIRGMGKSTIGIGKVQSPLLGIKTTTRAFSSEWIKFGGRNPPLISQEFIEKTYPVRRNIISMKRRLYQEASQYKGVRYNLEYKTGLLSRTRVSGLLRQKSVRQSLSVTESRGAIKKGITLLIEKKGQKPVVLTDKYLIKRFRAEIKVGKPTYSKAYQKSTRSLYSGKDIKITRTDWTVIKQPKIVTESPIRQVREMPFIFRKVGSLSSRPLLTERGYLKEKSYRPSLTSYLKKPVGILDPKVKLTEIQGAQRNIFGMERTITSSTFTGKYTVRRIVGPQERQFASFGQRVSDFLTSKRGQLNLAPTISRGKYNLAYVEQLSPISIPKINLMGTTPLFRVSQGTNLGLSSFAAFGAFSSYQTQRTNAQTITRTRQSFRTLQSINLKQIPLSVFDTRSLQRMQTSEIQSQKVRENLIFDLSQQQVQRTTKVQKTKTSQRLVNIFGGDTPLPTNVFSFTPFPTSKIGFDIPPPPPPPFPTFKEKDISKIGNVKGGKRQYKYTPTLRSTFFGFKGKTPMGTLTGLEDRPIPL